jgi:hypothetical protein
MRYTSIRKGFDFSTKGMRVFYIIYFYIEENFSLFFLKTIPCQYRITSIAEVLHYPVSFFLDIFRGNRVLAEYLPLACLGKDTIVDPVVNNG